MKKLLLFVLLIAPVLSFAQTANVKSKQTKTFCTVDVYQRGSVYQVYLNDGSQKKMDDMLVKDDKGKYRKFDSIVSILNYVTQLGWNFVSSYSLLTPGQANPHGFIFEKSAGQ